MKLQVWDTAGQERFRTITQTYYKGAMGIILVYDSTEEQTFSNIRNWIKQIEQHASDDVAKVLVGNKCDRQDKAVDTERGKEPADEYGLAFFETSAKAGTNIPELFYHLAEQIIKDKKHGPTMKGGANGEARGTVSLGGKKDNKKKKEGGCC